MIQVIVDQGFLGGGNRLFDGMQLLHDSKAGLALVNHHDDVVQVPIGTLEPVANLRMSRMDVRKCHCKIILPRRIHGFRAARVLQACVQVIARRGMGAGCAHPRFVPRLVAREIGRNEVAGHREEHVPGLL